MKKKADAFIEYGREYVCRYRIPGCDAVEVRRVYVGASVGVCTPEVANAESGSRSHRFKNLTNTNNTFSKQRRFKQRRDLLYCQQN